MFSSCDPLRPSASLRSFCITCRELVNATLICLIFRVRPRFWGDRCAGAHDATQRNLICVSFLIFEANSGFRISHILRNRSARAAWPFGSTAGGPGPVAAIGLRHAKVCPPLFALRLRRRPTARESFCWQTMSGRAGSGYRNLQHCRGFAHSGTAKSSSSPGGGSPSSLRLLAPNIVFCLGLQGPLIAKILRQRPLDTVVRPNLGAPDVIQMTPIHEGHVARLS